MPGDDLTADDGISNASTDSTEASETTAAEPVPDTAAADEEEEDGDDDDDDSPSYVTTGDRKRRRTGCRPSVPREAVRLIARGMVKAQNPALQMDRGGVDALHAALESFASDVFATSQELLDLADRSTVHVPFLRAAARLHEPGRGMITSRVN